MVSQGVPMILHGDEVGRSQGGNNNVYCQDNETSWMDWDLDEEQRDLLAFTKRVVALRREHPVFRRRRFFAGEAPPDGRAADIAWFTPEGKNMSDADWSHEFARSMLVFVNGDAIPEPDQRGEKVLDDSFLIAFNGHHEPLTFVLPDEVYGEGWLVALDTHDDQAGSVSIFDDATTLLPGVEFRVADRSIVVLRRPRPPRDGTGNGSGRSAR
jgi:glycogen operon protein